MKSERCFHQKVDFNVLEEGMGGGEMVAHNSHNYFSIS